MLAVFCVRLAAGMAACLLLLSPAASARPGPGAKPLAAANFFRTHLLVVLGFAVLALLVGQTLPTVAVAALLIAAAAATVGSVSWSLERSPGGVSLIVVAVASLVAAVVVMEPRWPAALSSAFLLGAAMSAMLMGHNYLVAPGMTLTPLYRLLTALAVALVVRAAVDGVGLARWMTEHGGDTLMTGDRALWLPVRWLVGLVGTAVLTALAWQTARLRATQSATGILYVAVIFCFLGELTGQLLQP